MTRMYTNRNTQWSPKVETVSKELFQSGIPFGNNIGIGMFYKNGKNMLTILPTLNQYYLRIYNYSYTGIFNEKKKKNLIKVKVKNHIGSTSCRFNAIDSVGQWRLMLYIVRSLLLQTYYTCRKKNWITLTMKIHKVTWSFVATVLKMFKVHCLRNTKLNYTQVRVFFYGLWFFFFVFIFCQDTIFFLYGGIIYVTVRSHENRLRIKSNRVHRVLLHVIRMGIILNTIFHNVIRLITITDIVL